MYLPDRRQSGLRAIKLFDRFTRCERRLTSRRNVDARSGMRINGLRDGVTEYDVGVANMVRL